MRVQGAKLGKAEAAGPVKSRSSIGWSRRLAGWGAMAALVAVLFGLVVLHGKGLDFQQELPGGAEGR